MTSTYEQLLETKEGREALAEEHAMAHVGELIANLLEKSGMTRTQLAEKLELSRGRITQILDGDANLTLGTIARVLNAFGHLFECSSRPMNQLKVQRVWHLPTSEWDWPNNEDVSGRIGFTSDPTCKIAFPSAVKAKNFFKAG